MKRIVCEHLASLMCMMVDTTRTSDHKDTKNNEQDCVNVSLLNKHLFLTSLSSASPSAVPSAEHGNSPAELLLASINDMLQTKLRNDAQLRHQADKNQQMMNEWMIAAAVIDRFCFIIFTITLIIGSLAFYVVFLWRP